MPLFSTQSCTGHNACWDLSTPLPWQQPEERLLESGICFTSPYLCAGVRWEWKKLFSTEQTVSAAPTTCSFYNLNIQLFILKLCSPLFLLVYTHFASGFCLKGCSWLLSRIIYQSCLSWITAGQRDGPHSVSCLITWSSFVLCYKHWIITCCSERSRRWWNLRRARLNTSGQRERVQFESS